ncbi:MAG: hypothetical protein QW814_00980 [Methanothrix sp.]
MKYILDENTSLNHRLWLLANSKLTIDELVEIAMCNKFPSLSINAFSLIDNEVLKVNTLIKMFSSGKNDNMAVIIHSSIKGIKSKKLLWDLYIHPSTPRYAKQYIEDRINDTGTSATPKTNLIRLEKPKDKFSEEQ